MPIAISQKEGGFMKMARRRPARATPEPVSDFGPRIGGALRPDVVLLDRPDPEAPNRTIRVAQRRAGYDWLHARGVLSDSQREAADRYCVAHERETGASERRRAIIARVPPWQKGHPTMEMLEASRTITEAQAAVRGHANREVLDGVVLEGKTLEALSAQLSEPVPGILGRLRACLDILAEQWGID